jgi:O-acetyl-ADP-ribose deacetylase (regulator of RNase III)
MIHYTKGNLLEADVEAVVNTVNTVGVMGKGIALMFKERFPKNMQAYAKACKAKEVQTGKVFVTETGELMGPKWIVNFPTKQHWRAASKMEWIVDGLQDLKSFLIDNEIKSIAIPPLGAGNGKLDWSDVKPEIEKALAGVPGVDIYIFEPTSKYQNVAKKIGVKELTPARAMIAELVRRYWVLGMECSLLEIQKLAWFLEREIERKGLINPLDLRFEAQRYGPYADRLRHLLDKLDGSYLHCDKRISDAAPEDAVWFEEKERSYLDAFLASEDMKPYLAAIDEASKLIDGFESPYGLELLSSVDWLINKEKLDIDISALQEGLRKWPYQDGSGERKAKLFDSRVLGIALDRLNQFGMYA